MKLAAKPRKPGHANRLRAQGILPAVVYNHTLNESISVVLNDFDKVFRTLGLSGVIDLEVEGGETHEVLVKQVQMDKRRRIPQHVDFFATIKGQAVDVSITVEYEGTPEGVRDGGILSVTHEVIINVLPRRIPKNFVIDVSHLKHGETLHIADLANQLPEGAFFLDDDSVPIATVTAARSAKEEDALEDEAAEAAQPEVIGEKKEDE